MVCIPFGDYLFSFFFQAIQFVNQLRTGIYRALMINQIYHPFCKTNHLEQLARATLTRG